MCAAAFASFVCEPPLTSPAGAGVVLHGSSERGWSALDFFARVPGLAGAPKTLDFFSVVVDFGATTQEFHVGRGAAAVPGALRGLVHLHTTHGRLPLADVVAPALALARDGYTVSRGIAGVVRLLEPIMTLTPGIRALVGTDAELARGGERLRNDGQAHLLEAVGRDPREALRAFEADLVVHFGPGEGGLLSELDLQRWSPLERAPLRVAFAGATVLTMPPPSAGGALVGLGLRLAEATRLLELPFGEHWPRLAEVLGAVSAARAGGYDVRLEETGYLDALLSDDGVGAAWHRWQQAVTERALGGTTHISVLDGEDGAASLTASNGEGCGHVLPGWGVHMNNFLGEEDINPHGFHAAPPGTEMRTMMSPTLVLEAGRPVLALGSGGSNRLRSAVLQALIHHRGFELDLDEAILADRLHVEGRKLWFEATGMDAPLVSALELAWPDASRFETKSMFFGGVHAAAFRDGRFEGFGDPRRDGAVCTADEV